MTKSVSSIARIILFCFVSILGVQLLFLSGVNTAYIVTLIVWLFLMAYALQKLVENMVLLCFLASFFVFLLSREFVYFFFDVKRNYLYLEQYNNITFLLMLVSLLILFVGYNYKFIIAAFQNRIGYVSHSNFDEPDLGKTIIYQRVYEIAFWLCYISAMIITSIKVLFVRRNGYLASYLEGDIYGGLGFLSYLSSFLIVAISLYLSTKPSKKKSMIVLVLYEFYGVLSLFTGHRYIFIAVSMYSCIYFCLRHKKEGGWIKRKYVISVAIILPMIIVLMTAMDSLRLGKSFEFSSMKSSFISFFDQQGGSDNVIKRVFYYEDELKDMEFTSLSNTHNLLFENAIIRKLFNIKVFSGNSVEHALYGNSLAHRLSYYEYGSWYLEGRGVGSCYIAELYHDFKWLGVIFGSLLYGILLKKISDISFKKPFRDGILLATTYYIILAPRGEFDAAVGNVFSLYSLIIMAVIWLSIKIISSRMGAVGGEECKQCALRI